MPAAQLTRKAPAAAFRLTTPAALRLPAPPAVGELAAPATLDPVPCRLYARSPDVINHWWWGPLCHDLAGLRRKDKTPLDYQHDPEDLIGYADAHSIDPEAGLILDGQLTPIAPDDRAAEILAKSAAGIPYEVSITFDPLASTYEWLPEGYQTNVNGRVIEGPCTIVRTWPLIATAICENGADANTRAELAAGHLSAPADATHEITLTPCADAVATPPADLTPPAPPPDPPQTAASLTARTLPAADLQHATETAALTAAVAAGVDQLTAAKAELATARDELTAARAELETLRGNLATLTTERDALAQRLPAAERLDQLGAGEREAPTFQAADPQTADPRFARLAAIYGDNLAKAIIATKIVPAAPSRRR